MKTRFFTSAFENIVKESGIVFVLNTIECTIFSVFHKKIIKILFSFFLLNKPLGFNTIDKNIVSTVSNCM